MNWRDAALSIEIEGFIGTAKVSTARQTTVRKRSFIVIARVWYERWDPWCGLLDVGCGDRAGVLKGLFVLLS